MGHPNVSVISLRKWYLGNYSGKKQPKDYPFLDNGGGGESKCPIIGELLSKLFSS